MARLLSEAWGRMWRPTGGARHDVTPSVKPPPQLTLPWHCCVDICRHMAEYGNVMVLMARAMPFFFIPHARHTECPGISSQCPNGAGPHGQEGTEKLLSTQLAEGTHDPLFIKFLIP